MASGEFVGQARARGRPDHGDRRLVSRVRVRGGRRQEPVARPRAGRVRTRARRAAGLGPVRLVRVRPLNGGGRAFATATLAATRFNAAFTKPSRRRKRRVRVFSETLAETGLCYPVVIVAVVVVVVTINKVRDSKRDLSTKKQHKIENKYIHSTQSALFLKRYFSNVFTCYVLPKIYKSFASMRNINVGIAVFRRRSVLVLDPLLIRLIQITDLD